MSIEKKRVAHILTCLVYSVDNSSFRCTDARYNAYKQISNIHDFLPCFLSRAASLSLYSHLLSRSLRLFVQCVCTLCRKILLFIHFHFVVFFSFSFLLTELPVRSAILYLCRAWISIRLFCGQIYYIH